MTLKTITGLKVQKRNRNRVSVYLDGAYAFGLTRIVAAWLQVGQELSEERIEQLQAEDGQEVAYQRALRFLSYRVRSEAEVRTHLARNEVTPEVCELILDRLRESRLVDDRAFAQAWIDNRSEHRPRGQYALKAELRQKQISDEIITELLEGLEETQLAYRAAAKKVKQLRDLDWPEFQRKMTGFLARRGFSYEIIRPTVRKVWEQGLDS
jgi:regulatory protein